MADPVGDLGVDALRLLGRYRVTVVGKEEVFAKPGPYLILPNHPALCRPAEPARPPVAGVQDAAAAPGDELQEPASRPFAWLLRAINMPDIVRASAEDRRRAEKAGRGGHRGAEGRRERHPLAERAALARRLREARRGADRRRRARRRARRHGRARPHPRAVRQHVQLGRRAAPAREEPREAIGLWLANLFVFAPRRRVTVTLEAFTPGTSARARRARRSTAGSKSGTTPTRRARRRRSSRTTSCSARGRTSSRRRPRPRSSTSRR